MVSLHVDGRPGNAGFFGADEFAAMKPRALFINASRGMVVDYESLRDHLLSGHIAGAAVDVFPVEPKAQGDAFDSVLRGLDNVILTPHVGGSTQEAQEEIGWFVAEKLARFALEGSTALSVNLPPVLPPTLTPGHRLGFLHHNVPGVLAELNAVFAAAGDNVVDQTLATRDHLGYVVTDVSAPLSTEAVEQLTRSEHCLWIAHLVGNPLAPADPHPHNGRLCPRTCRCRQALSQRPQRVVNMNDFDATDVLAAARQPALKMLAATIDREFERREPTTTTPLRVRRGPAGRRRDRAGRPVRGVDTAARPLRRPLAVRRAGPWSAEHAGAFVDPPAASETVQGAAGDLRAFHSATVVLPAGAIGPMPVVLRIVSGSYGIEVELIGRAEDADGLPEAFVAFLRARRTSDSPYRLGAYRVSTNNRGLVLNRWTPPAATRELLKLDAVGLAARSTAACTGCWSSPTTSRLVGSAPGPACCSSARRAPARPSSAPSSPTSSTARRRCWCPGPTSPSTT